MWDAFLMCAALLHRSALWGRCIYCPVLTLAVCWEYILKKCWLSLLNHNTDNALTRCVCARHNEKPRGVVSASFFLYGPTVQRYYPYSIIIWLLCHLLEIYTSYVCTHLGQGGNWRLQTAAFNSLTWIINPRRSYIKALLGMLIPTVGQMVPIK